MRVYEKVITGAGIGPCGLVRKTMIEMVLIFEHYTALLHYVHSLEWHSETNAK